MTEVVAGWLAALWSALAFDLNYIEWPLAAAALFLFYRRGLPRVLRFPPAEQIWARASESPARAIVSAAGTFLLLRIALLPVLPAPQPYLFDEYSHLLVADTMAQGRLANPVHPLWQHFEAIHVLARPTYASMYFPMSGLMLAFGQVVLGAPWLGLLAGNALLCAALCWALGGFLPTRWALTGSLIAALRYCLASYWGNSYWGGCVGALGGALVWGSVVRLRRQVRIQESLLLAAGLLVLANSRPFEGLVCSLPACAWLLYDLCASHRLLDRRTLVRFWAPLLVVGLAGGLLMGGYFYAVTGSPWKVPYRVNQEQYGWPMTLPGMAHTGNAALRHPDFQQYFDWEADEHRHLTTLAGLLERLPLKLELLWRFYLGPILSLSLLGLPLALRSRPLRWPLAGLAVTLLAVLAEQSSYVHYLSPAAVLILLVMIQSFRFLRHASPQGPLLVTAIPVLAASVLLVRLAAPSLHLPYTHAGGLQSWCCAMPGNTERVRFVQDLTSKGGQHVIVVKPRRDVMHTPEWVYNGAEIDTSAVIWARDMGPERNEELVSYYSGRSIWYLDPDARPLRLQPYAPAIRAANP